jgi:hypothetical protein
MFKRDFRVNPNQYHLSRLSPELVRLVSFYVEDILPFCLRFIKIVFGKLHRQIEQSPLCTIHIKQETVSETHRGIMYFTETKATGVIPTLAIYWVCTRFQRGVFCRFRFRLVFIKVLFTCIKIITTAEIMQNKLHV